MLYKCKICDKEFKQKSNYTDHLNRIKQCVKLTEKLHQNPQNNENRCNYCYKIYCRTEPLKCIILYTFI